MKTGPWRKSGWFWALVLISLFWAYAGFLFATLPDIGAENQEVAQIPSLIYSRDGVVLAKLHGSEAVGNIPLAEISPDLQKAVLAIEDRRFWEHRGIDFTGMARALLTNILEARIAEGGSTITQQLARTLYLSRRRSITRKLQEILLALELERRYSKEEILELYLNHVYWGHNVNGVDSASRLYFGKSPQNLTLDEAATLAGLLEAPDLYSPYRNQKLTLARRSQVLATMAEVGFISPEQAQLTSQTKLSLATTYPNPYHYLAPYFTSMVVQELSEQYPHDDLYGGGLIVTTTLDFKLQKTAEELISQFVKSEGLKYNFRQMALVSIDPRTGDVRALVGGADFKSSEFNRAIQAKRQPGSSFKPFIYSAAIESGISPGTILQDRPYTRNVPVSIWTPQGTWSPKNFDGKFHGPVTLREALERSLNIPSLHILERVGPEKAVAMARRMGITSHLEPQLSLALGSYELSLFELTSAYTPLAHEGVRTKPRLILKVEGKDGKVLEEARLNSEQVMDPNVAAIMTDIMQGVLIRGTGVRARLPRPAAAKSGTTEDFRDAWFIGFVPQLLTGVWAGNDDNLPMEGVAEVSVCPRVWKAFMTQALENEPVLAFTPPRGLEVRAIDIDSGQLATVACPATRVRPEKYFPSQVPTEACTLHSVSSGEAL